MRIIFQNNQLNELGTAIAVYDYALYNEKYLNNESFILTRKHNIFPHDQKVIEKFQKSFKNKVFFYNSWNEAENIIKENKIDVLYTLKGGNKDEVVSNNVKTCVHVVFQVYEPHGDIYCYISKWLSEKMTNGKYPYVPHMINLPNVEEDLREHLNIPKNAIVFGRYGNLNSFNLPFTIEAINRIVKENKNIYFLFSNTLKRSPECRIPLSDHKQIIMLDKIIDLEYKVKFINTCDAMIHARINGESFGLSIGEFSIKNKPVLTWSGNNVEKYYNHKHDMAHLDILGDKAIVYNDYNVYEVISNFKPNINDNYDAYSSIYSPSNVMNIFNNIFLK